jgi:hypothetical protein
MENCVGLPCTVMPCENGIPYWESCWQLTPEEIEQIAATGRVYIGVLAIGHPPICVNAKTQITQSVPVARVNVIIDAQVFSINPGQHRIGDLKQAAGIAQAYRIGIGGSPKIWEDDEIVMLQGGELLETVPPDGVSG